MARERTAKESSPTEALPGGRLGTGNPQLLVSFTLQAKKLSSTRPRRRCGFGGGNSSD
jgi:hypothetical protein